MNAMIILFLFVLLVASNSEAAEFAIKNGPATPAITAMTRDPAQDQAKGRTRDGARVPEKVAAPDRAVSSTVSSVSAEPFGLNTELVATGEVLRKWSSVEADIRAESKILTRCRENITQCSLAAQKFLAIVEEGRTHSGRGRIGVINRAINLAIRPTSDLAQWGVEDRWTAPLATLASGRGDCEDYAIAKYAALREVGVADVKLVVVHDLAVGEDHAVVAARLDGGWIMLDNRWLALIDDEKMRRVLPLLVLDSDGVKQYEAVRTSAVSASGLRSSTRLWARIKRSLG
jgi:predicted transglutaminase-like cysteine proteinase